MILLLRAGLASSGFPSNDVVSWECSMEIDPRKRSVAGSSFIVSSEAHMGKSIASTFAIACAHVLLLIFTDSFSIHPKLKVLMIMLLTHHRA